MTKTSISALEEIYGEMPTRPLHLSYKTEACDPTFAAGGAALKRQSLIIDLGEREITIPFISIIPSTPLPCPAIVNLGFEREIPNKYLPAEEIIDRGYAIFHLCIDDISENNADFKSKAASAIAKSRRKRSAAGKPMLWAWAIIRAIEHLTTLDAIDKSSITVSGHGISGISAILAAIFEETIGYVIANDLFYAFGGLKADAAASRMPHLFCPSYADGPSGDPIKALLEACEGKEILIGSAADKPLANLDAEKEAVDDLNSRYYRIHYYTRGGCEYFSRRDWNRYLDYIDQKNRKIIVI